MTRTEGTVYIVDDDPDVRKSLGRLMESVRLAFRTFETANEFLKAFDADGPSCLVLDVRMPGISGMELQRQFAENDITIPVIMVTGHGDVPMAVEALQRGVIDFMEKPVNPQKLLDRIHQALAQDIERRRTMAERDAAGARFALLTEREREVVGLAVRGQTNKQIAIQLGVSPQAIDATRARAMDKLQVNSVAELVRLTLEAGIS